MCRKIEAVFFRETATRRRKSNVKLRREQNLKEGGEAEEKQTDREIDVTVMRTRTSII